MGLSSLVLRRFVVVLSFFLLAMLILVASYPTQAQTETWTTYPDNYPDLSYGNGTWTYVPNLPDALGGDLTYTTDPNATLDFAFTGTGVEIVFSGGAEGGTFSAQLFDSGYDEVGETQAGGSYSPTYVYGRTLRWENLPLADYHLVVTNTSGALWIEGVRVEGTLTQPQAAFAVSSASVPQNGDWYLGESLGTATLTGGDGEHYLYLTFSGQPAAYGMVYDLEIQGGGFLNTVHDFQNPITSLFTNDDTPHIASGRPICVANMRTCEELLGQAGVEYDYGRRPVIWYVDGFFAYDPSNPRIDENEEFLAVWYWRDRPGSVATISNMRLIHYGTPPTLSLCTLATPSPIVPNEAADMQAIVTFERIFVPPSGVLDYPLGLTVHAGPTLNAMRLGYFGWGASITVSEQFEVTDTSGVVQRWYKVTIRNDGVDVSGFTASPRLPGGVSEGWVNALWTEPGSPPVQYQYITNCSGAVNPATTFTFPYDRIAAAEYGIAHSTENDAAPPRGITIINRPLTSPQFADIPYAEFEYATVNHTNKTGSAAFVSELMWIGGMPMTEDTNASDPCAGAVIGGGWQRTENSIGIADGSNTWLNHQRIVSYYTDSLLPFPELCDTWRRNVVLPATTTRGSLVPASIRFGSYTPCFPDPGVPIPTFSTSCYEVSRWETTFSRIGIATYMEAIDDGRVDIASSSAFSNYVNSRLNQDGQIIQTGDYIWIDSINPSAPPLTQTGHGLLIIGWAQIMNCADALNQTFTFGNNLYSTWQEANNASVASVPYVVDFNNQLQSQRARPFYCTMYEEAGSLNFYDHDWWFYTMPDSIIIEESQLFVDPQWEWH